MIRFTFTHNVTIDPITCSPCYTVLELDGKVLTKFSVEFFLDCRYGINDASHRSLWLMEQLQQSLGDMLTSAEMLYIVQFVSGNGTYSDPDIVGLIGNIQFNLVCP